MNGGGCLFGPYCDVPGPVVFITFSVDPWSAWAGAGLDISIATIAVQGAAVPHPPVEKKVRRVKYRYVVVAPSSAQSPFGTET